MSIFDRRFPTGAAIKAAGITNATLQNWMRRGHVIGHHAATADILPVVGGDGPGDRRAFSFHTAMQLAIAKAISDCSGMDAKDSLYAGGYFAHTGDVYESEGHPSRMCGLPFDPEFDGDTFIGIARHPDQELPAVGEFRWKPGRGRLYSTVVSRLRSENFVLVFANPIFERVVLGLGYDPHEVLALAYGAERLIRQAAAR